MSRRILIIGLDSTTFDVMNSLIEDRLMPNLVQLD